MLPKNLIIAGSGRSGTTWVQDVLAEANGLRTVFEPLHPLGVSRARGLAYRYVPADDEAPELRRFFDDLLGGHLRGLWPDYRIRPDRFNPLNHGVREVVWNARKLIRHRRQYRDQRARPFAVIKMIRANLMLPWIASHYEVPILLVVRHPCAVIASRLKIGGGDWDAHRALGHYLGDRRLAEVVYGHYGVDITRTDRGPEATLAMVWCIENMLPLAWADEYGFVVISYEGLLADPETQWRRVVQALGLSLLPPENILKAPSQQVAPDLRNREIGVSNTAKWRNELDGEQLERIAGVLNEFGCSQYRVDRDGFVSG